MDIQAVFGEVVGLLSTASPLVVLALFFICVIGEFGPAIPFLLETIWILSGYQLSHWIISGYPVSDSMSPPLSLLLLIAGATAGREAGSIALYYFSQYGSMPLIMFYHRHFAGKADDKKTIPQKISQGLGHLSPFTVAFGRLIWLRIPLTLTLGTQRKLGVLVSGVFLSALVWDGSYVILGATAGTAVMAKPGNMVIYSVAGLSFLYAAAFVVKRIRKYLADRKQRRAI